MEAEHQEDDPGVPFFTSLLADLFKRHYRLPSGGCNCEAEVCLTGPWVERELRKENIVPIYRSEDAA